MIRLAIFASGNGSNAQRITEYFSGHSEIKVDSIVYNVKDAFVAERAKSLNIPAHYFGRKDFYENGNVINFLREHQIDWVILAGFLWLVPQDILTEFHHRVINIHPALLPKYGGKGMYGNHVHEAVITNKETESGITIHLVDEEYDKGEFLFQARCEVLPTDDANSLAEKIHGLEFQHFPIVIEKTVMSCE